MQSTLAGDGLPEVALSSEHYFDDVVFGRIMKGEALPYPGEHAMLLEFYESDFPHSIDRRFADLRLKKKLVPVIAHPERYQRIWKDPDVLERLLDAGAAALLDTAALVGKYGRRPAASFRGAPGARAVSRRVQRRASARGRREGRRRHASRGRALRPRGSRFPVSRGPRLRYWMAPGGPERMPRHDRQAEQGWLRRHWLKLMASLVIAGGFAWLMHAGALPILSDCERRSRTCAGGPCPAYLSLWCFVHYMRAVRWYWLLEPIHRVPLRRVLAWPAIGFAAIVLLPFRAGEVVRPVMIRRKGHLSGWAATGHGRGRARDRRPVLERALVRGAPALAPARPAAESDR